MVKMFILQHTSDHLVLFTQHTNLDFIQIHIADSLSGGLASIWSKRGVRVTGDTGSVKCDGSTLAQRLWTLAQL